MKVYDTDLARYWVIDSWKWYQDFPNIKAIEDFFSELSDRADIRRSVTNIVSGSVYEESIACFAAIRLGEESDDYEEWGEPWAYDIGEVRYINHPNQE